MTAPTFAAYVGRQPCGCPTFVIVDDPLYKADTAKEVARAIKDGLVIERVIVSEANPLKVGACIHVAKAPATNQAALL